MGTAVMVKRDEQLSCTRRVYADNSVEGIAVNPMLSPDAELTGDNLNELKDWWNKPYIVTKAWSDIEAAYAADNALLQGGCAGNCASRQKQLERAKRVARKDWFNTYPNGIRYEIRCLDGQIPGRTTVWGTEATLLDALLRAKAGPAWM